ncbi:MAG: cysteine desulfurase [Bacillota bacterium]|nr:MAG: cysteine desulfurase [Bacillota bacterium]MBS3951302.1 aminotransferase class V-fold PLP-dependent enzyme [Peptococcaceae bacterium]
MKDTNLRIYLDNAATTWPKPPAVATAINDFITQGAANPGRGGHGLSLATGRMVFDCRKKLGRLFNVQDESRVIFTSNATQALNMAVFGTLSPGDHCITTSMEHNAVSRPLHYLQGKGVEVTVIPCNSQGELSLGRLQAAFQANTRLVALTHASNVCGTLLPVQEACSLARQHGALTLLDAAQTAGVYPLDAELLGVDLLAVPGHKSLLGPTGTGALYIGPRTELRPSIYGGTGSFSELLEMPDVLPDRFESGTLNTVGIAGLSSALDYIEIAGLTHIRTHETALAKLAWRGLQAIGGIKVYGTGDGAPIVAFNVGEIGSTEVAYILDASFNIATRAGLHCAPWAHQTLGTYAQGVVRVSPGVFTTIKEIDTFLEAVEAIKQEMT